MLTGLDGARLPPQGPSRSLAFLKSLAAKASRGSLAFLRSLLAIFRLTHPVTQQVASSNHTSGQIILVVESCDKT
jgi:hypothetical protein